MNINPQKKNTEQIVGPHTAGMDVQNAEAMYGLLVKAAKIAAQAGFPPEAFAAAAWQSYLNASPELAERLAEKQFETALEELRLSGRMAKA
jgi:hypothetical protein